MIDEMLNRFRGATPELLRRIVTPYRVKILTFEWSGSFEALFPEDAWVATFAEGTTGKVIPYEHVESGAPWKELAKARVRQVEHPKVRGELYPAGGQTNFAGVRVGDYIEIDPFGITSKLVSAVSEAAFAEKAASCGFQVTRMPENVAKHVGTQGYYDFRLERDGQVYRVELKSLWGTDTTRARLIHTVTKGGSGKNKARSDKQRWLTSSCRFQDQDIFAVSMWLRGGVVTDFVFALSLPSSRNAMWGLPEVPGKPDHVTQNPPVVPLGDPWTDDLLEVCQRHDSLGLGILPTVEPVIPSWFKVEEEDNPTPPTTPAVVKHGFAWDFEGEGDD